MIRICNRCVMTSTIDDIVFDSDGICNYCKYHEQKVQMTPFKMGNSSEKINKLIKKIKIHQKGKYDSIVGLSGGVDSSYVAYKAVKLGLRPLAVHFDNGWNSELAVKNIENIVKNLNLDLVTFVIDWNEFKDIQKSFIKANVIDIEMVTDHAIFAAMYKIARKYRIRYILSGTNATTESIMPPSWQHFKFDLRNIKSIHKKFGTIPINNYPTINILQLVFNHYIYGAKSVSILNYFDYRKKDAMNILKRELGWKYYGGKHYESIFTKFYQAYILPVKFGVDKRRIHFSDLIMNNEISRSDAMIELSKSSYDIDELEDDTTYVCKKLGLSRDQFDSYMSSDSVSHFQYPSNAKLTKLLMNFYKMYLRRY